MTVQAVLSNKGRDIATVAPDKTVSDAVAVLGELRIGALPIVDAGGIIGIMSERDVIYCLREHGPQVLDWPVTKVMTAPAITVEPSTPILSALSMMTERRIRHLPVVSGDTICGIVSIGDLVKYRMEKIQQEAEAMRSYIQGV